MPTLFSFFLGLPGLVQALIPVFAALFPNATGGLTKAAVVTQALTPVITGIVTAAAQSAGASADHTAAAVSAATDHVETAVAAHPVVADGAAQAVAASA
jgi:hypothetical protein